MLNALFWQLHFCEEHMEYQSQGVHVNSPMVDSPSPMFDSPIVNSPMVNSPMVNSLSPMFDSPIVNSPMVNLSIRRLYLKFRKMFECAFGF
uniref:Meis_PKNOX_N domain-containing protein n=1 Tax=Globodera pallida TaxID=36090 RepID=A0A183CRK1_GLOPA